MPSRLLELAGDILRLVETKYLLDRRIPYATLSYCWGDPAVGPFKTTTENFHQHLQDVPHKSLTKTVQDAVTVTLALGMRFLWVDSLCIVQDDAADWTNEAPRMADIFAGCEVTLAAACSDDAHGGLFLHSSKPAMVCEASTRTPGWSLRRKPSIEDCSDFAGRLYERGWVFQEMLLPSRIIHFGKEQFCWQCRCEKTAEDGLFETLRFFDFNQEKALTRDHVTIDELRMDTQREWTEIVEAYSATQFSYWTDRLVAFAGVASSSWVGIVLGLRPAALHTDLAWTLHFVFYPSGLARRSAIEGIPSYTWFAWNAPVEYSARDCKSSVEYLSSNVEFSGPPMASGLVNATLRLRGCLARFEIDAYDDFMCSDTTHTSYGTSREYISTESYDCQIDLRADLCACLLEEEINMDFEALHFLLLGCEIERGEPDKWCSMLVVQRLEKTTTMSYRRVGYASGVLTEAKFQSMFGKSQTTVFDLE